MFAMLLLQAVAGPPLPADLRKPVARASTPCVPNTADGGEIVVCGHPTDQRLAKLPERYVKPRGDPMTFQLPGGGTGNVHAVQTTLPGATGSGLVVALKIPLGTRTPPSQ